MLQWLQFLVKTILPYTCILCGQETDVPQDLCVDCENDLPIIESPCEQCGADLTPQTATICGQCIQEERHYDRIVAIYNYETPIQEMILKLKFQHELLYARLLAGLMQKQLRNKKISLPDLIIPVPMHPRRLKERGFNQAVELSKVLAQHFDVPLGKTSCRKIFYTDPQSLLRAEKRAANVKNTFAVWEDISKKNIVVIDDVVTTGATVNELSKSLKLAGARWVEVWCIARTRPH